MFAKIYIYICLQYKNVCPNHKVSKCCTRRLPEYALRLQEHWTRLTKLYTYFHPCS